MNLNEFKTAIAAHIRKTGRFPNLNSLGNPTNENYEIACQAFREMLADGTVVAVTVVSAKGRRSTVHRLAE